MISVDIHYFCSNTLYEVENILFQHPSVCSWYTSMTLSCSISRAFGVSSSLMRLPSNRQAQSLGVRLLELAHLRCLLYAEMDLVGVLAHHLQLDVFGLLRHGSV